MNGIHHITIDNEQYGIRFNNYARTELMNFFKKPDEFQLSEQQFTERLIEKWNENETALIKTIVYAGVVGFSLVKHDTPLLSKEQVGEYIGDAKPDELINIWKVFLASQGINTNKEPEEQKKKKPTKKRKTPKKSS